MAVPGATVPDAAGQPAATGAFPVTATASAVFVWFVRPGLRRQRKGIRAMVNNIRVLRGGSWDDFRRGCRSADRIWINPGSRFKLYGFRVVRVPRITSGGKGNEQD
jgi:formylglycine-generating enzyme required for sulfatase activity